jgi:hypothetical protein
MKWLRTPAARVGLWWSDIEACITQFDDVVAHLEERRRNRKPCECLPQDRPPGPVSVLFEVHSMF